MIKDHLTLFHFFYKIDTALKLHLIYNFNEIPIGATIESPRAEIEFYINGKFHMLKFGYWSLGDCGEWYASGGNVNGAGTTSVKITRHTPTSYTIEAPKGSVGRLWDIDNRTKPIDKGLYESGFIIHVDTHQDFEQFYYSQQAHLFYWGRRIASFIVLIAAQLFVPT